MNTSKFLGRGWSFPPRFSNAGAELEMVSGEQDIQEALKILLCTAPETRVMRPEYGCDMQQFVFEEKSQSLVADLKETIDKSVLNNEPRVKVNNIDVDDSGLEEGVVAISLDYTIKATNSRYNMVYPFYIREHARQQL